MTKFLLDSGDPDEYREVAGLMNKNGAELWGATTNPSLIAKKLAGRKFTQDEAVQLQKDIVLEILKLVPGAVSAEVYADHSTTASEMAEQGREIATWHKRVVVKLPTTQEGLKARSMLRKDKIIINNTLVFSQQQIFAICLHEKLVQDMYGPLDDLHPPFISPFVGRLDDIGEDGMMLVEHGMKIIKSFKKIPPYTALPIWMLASSIRRPEHIKRSTIVFADIITAPAKAYKEFFTLSEPERDDLDIIAYTKNLKAIPMWDIPKSLYEIASLEEFEKAIIDKSLDITHPLTDKGIDRFVADWQAILQ